MTSLSLVVETIDKFAEIYVVLRDHTDDRVFLFLARRLAICC